MLSRQVRAVVIAVLLSIQGLVAAERDLSLHWRELQPAVADGKVKIALPNGARIEGTVVAVEPEALRIKISKTSDKKVQPKGEALIPRTQVSIAQVVKYGKKWRIVGALAGPAAVAAVAAAAFPYDVTEGFVPVIVLSVSVAAAAGAAIGGYYIGRSADRQTTTIRIIPESR